LPNDKRLTLKGRLRTLKPQQFGPDENSLPQPRGLPDVNEEGENDGEDAEADASNKNN